MEYSEAVKKLHQLEIKGISPGLERIEELTTRLGRPQDKLKNYIHITGTNGKGSVAVMVEAMLREQDLSTALFTSPHLHSHTERYRINGQPIGEENFARLFTTVYQHICEMVKEGWASPTEFEAVTALALLWFAEQNVEYSVIEVGLGGLSDSTNIIKAKIAVITNVGMDHMDFLGDTLSQIAKNKAGIIKPGSVVVTGASGAALDVIEKCAYSLAAPLKVMNRDFSFQKKEITDYGSKLKVMTKTKCYADISLPLIGRHQLANASIAVQIGELLELDTKAITKGIGKVTWPARLEIIKQQPLIVLDGAHNYAGMEALTNAIDDLWPKKKIICLMGMLADKQREKSLQLLLLYIDKVVITRVPYLSRSGDWQKLAEISRQAGKPVLAIEDNREALNQVMGMVKEDEMILICGSLYLVAQIREYLLEEDNAICK